ncbi:MAG: threonine/serine exporter family protein [Clostridia bacterium]|nr:threonine/serine exporter family protein [Clostridia bacterium]
MEKRFGCAMDIGELMLVSGAEIRRVEESVSRMCYAFGATRVDVFIITSSMVVTVHTEDGAVYTQTRRVTSLTTDYEKLHRLNALSRKICEGSVSVQEIEETVSTIRQIKKVPLWLEIICYAMIAGAFAIFFGGTLVDAAAAMVVGIVVRLCLFVAELVITNKIFGKFFSTIVITVLAFLSVKLGWVATPDNIIIGNIMALIPGIGLTNAIRDLFTGDSIAGLLRSIEAVLAALAIAAGYFLVVLLGGFAV